MDPILPDIPVPVPTHQVLITGAPFKAFLQGLGDVEDRSQQIAYGNDFSEVTGWARHYCEEHGIAPLFIYESLPTHPEGFQGH